MSPNQSKTVTGCCVESPENASKLNAEIDRRIETFIKRHHVMTLSTISADGSPWCCQLFYAYMAASGVLVFSSSADTNHARQAVADGRVAGSILLESRIVGRLQGVQFTGVVEQCSDDREICRRAYLKRFPYAAVMLDGLWRVRLDFLKYTDNTLGFGTKLMWQRQK